MFSLQGMKESLWISYDELMRSCELNTAPKPIKWAMMISFLSILFLSFLRKVHFSFILLLLKAASCVSAEGGFSSRGGMTFTSTRKISEAGFSKQITSSHSVDSDINCAYLCGQMSARDGACNAFVYEGTHELLLFNSQTCLAPWKVARHHCCTTRNLKYFSRGTCLRYLISIKYLSDGTCSLANITYLEGGVSSQDAKKVGFSIFYNNYSSKIQVMGDFKSGQ